MGVALTSAVTTMTRAHARDARDTHDVRMAVRLRLCAREEASKRDSAATAAARAHGWHWGRGAVMTRVMCGDDVHARARDARDARASRAM